MRTIITLLLGLLVSGCALMPTHETAVVRLRDSLTFPFVVFDFFSVELRSGGLPGGQRSSAVSPGRQAIWVEVIKGPHGLFGIVPFLGRCYGTVSFDARAGHEYVVEFLRNSEDGALQVTEVATGFVVDQVPCVALR